MGVITIAFAAGFATSSTAQCLSLRAVSYTIDENRVSYPFHLYHSYGLLV
jgi:hypothetical protein